MKTGEFGVVAVIVIVVVVVGMGEVDGGKVTSTQQSESTTPFRSMVTIRRLGIQRLEIHPSTDGIGI